MSEFVEPVTGEVVPDRRRRGGIVMPPEIAKAIVKVSAEVRMLGMDDTNKFQNYGFVSIDKFLEFCRPIMAANGIAFLLNEVEHEVRQGMNDNGKPVAVLYLRWDIFIVHESGAVAGPFPRSVIVQGGMAQAFGSAQSYVWKQFARGLFAIPTGDKDDPDLHANDTVAQKTQQRPAQASPAPRPPQGAPAAQQASQEAPRAAGDPMREKYAAVVAELKTVQSEAALNELEIRHEEFMVELYGKQPQASQQLKRLIAQVRASFEIPSDEVYGDEEVPV